MAYGKVNVGGSGASKLNIFTQLTEPTTKEGIWIQCNEKYTKVICDSIFYFENAWDSQSTFATLPSGFTHGDSCTIGTDIYYAGSNTLGNRLYKYDTLTNTVTEEGLIPVSLTGTRMCSVDNDVYMFGTTNSAYYTRAYKFNIITKTFTFLLNIPYEFFGGDLEVCNGNIYLFGGNGGTTKAYRYNVSNNTYTELPTIPRALANQKCCTVGDRIYLLSSSVTSYYCLYYTVSTNTYTILPNMSYSLTQGCVVGVGTDIHLFGGLEIPTRHYKLDTLTHTFSSVSTIPFSFVNGACSRVENKIFTIGGQNTTTAIKCYSFIDKPFEENALILFRNSEIHGTYYTQIVTPKNIIENLFPRILSGFNNVWLFKDSKLQEYPCYYGNGSAWVKFKN